MLPSSLTIPPPGLLHFYLQTCEVPSGLSNTTSISIGVSRGLIYLAVAT